MAGGEVPVVGAVEDQHVGGALGGQAAHDARRAVVAARRLHPVVDDVRAPPVVAQAGLERAAIPARSARPVASGDAVAEGEIRVRAVGADRQHHGDGHARTFGQRDGDGGDAPGSELGREALRTDLHRACPRGNGGSGERALRIRFRAAAAQVQDDVGEPHILAIVDDPVSVLVVEHDPGDGMDAGRRGHRGRARRRDDDRRRVGPATALEEQGERGEDEGGPHARTLA